jgi:hypothetical protein
MPEEWREALSVIGSNGQLTTDKGQKIDFPFILTGS